MSEPEQMQRPVKEYMEESTEDGQTLVPSG